MSRAFPSFTKHNSLFCFYLPINFIGCEKKYKVKLVPGEALVLHFRQGEACARRSTRFAFSQPKHSLVLCYYEKLIEYLLTVLQVFLLPDYCASGEPDKMPHARISGSVHSPTVGVMIDMGNPLLNRTVDGFLKIGTVGASRVVAEETYGALSKGSVSKHDLEHTLKKMGKEGFKWGAVAGVYTGIEYGVERIRGRRDWTNALISGAVTGAAMSFSDSHYSRDKMIKDAITGGAIATAAEFIRYLT